MRRRRGQRRAARLCPARGIDQRPRHAAAVRLGLGALYQRRSSGHAAAPQTPEAYSVVWCCAPPRARRLAGLDDEAFSRELTEAFGTRLGRLRSAAPRHVFPLELKARHAQAHGRLATIGNAAQTLHPVAGQGLNLGLRDAAQLAHALPDWLAAPQADPSPCWPPLPAPGWPTAG